MLNMLLAQATTAPATQSQAQGNPFTMIIWFGLIIVIFYFLLLRPKQKEQKQREQMLGGVKKYDKVMTIGGVIGTVMEVRDDEIIVKVDENNNTRIKFTRGAIQKVIAPAAEEEKK